jgi:hypothetical protein
MYMQRILEINTSPASKGKSAERIFVSMPSMFIKNHKEH